MRRLYNEHSVAPCTDVAAARVESLITEAFERIWDEVVLAEDVCPRDVELLCQQTLSVRFSEEIVRRALAKRRAGSGVAG